MDTQIYELRVNNQLLRKINNELSIDKPYNVSLLIQRNKELEDTVCRSYREVQKLRADVFLLNQIIVENEKEQQ